MYNNAIFFFFFFIVSNKVTPIHLILNGFIKYFISYEMNHLINKRHHNTCDNILEFNYLVSLLLLFLNVVNSFYIKLDNIDSH